VNQPAEIDPEQAKQAARQEFKQETIEWVKMVVWFLILFAIVRTFVVEGYEVQGDSMVPTLNDHERILVFKLPHRLSRIGTFSGIEALKEGNIVVFDSPTGEDKRYVKRVVARGPQESGRKTVKAERRQSPDSPGPTVPVEFDRGTVYVNYKRVAEPYLPQGLPPGQDRGTVDLHPNQYYVLGDNRPVSKDSRSFGPVNDDRVIGKAIFRFWPLSKLGPL